MANKYWVGGTGTWDASSTANWSDTSGGASGAVAPTAADAVFFDSNSGSGTCTTVSGAVSASISFDSTTLNLVFGVNHTLTGTFTLTQGSIDLNNTTLTCQIFSSSNSNTRSITFGTGKITLTGNAATIFAMTVANNFSYTGSGDIFSTYSGATGTRTLQFSGTSGGTEANSPNIYVTAGTDQVTINTVKTLDLTGFSGTLRLNTRSVYGDFIISSGTTVTAGTSITTFAKTTGKQKITTSGKTIDFPIVVNGAGGTVELQDAFTQGSTRSFTLTNGTFDANNKNVSIGTFALGSGTKTLTLGSGTWTVQGASWNANTNVTGLTVSASTGTISMTSGSAKTFSGGGQTWPTLNQGGAGALTIAQSNTFANITNTVQPATIRFTAGTTQTVSAFSVSGTSGNLITLDTTVAGTQATLSDPSGLVSVSFCSIKDINATGGAFWQAYTVNGNVDGGNNLGWDFNATAWSYMYNVRKSKRILPGV